MGADGRPAVAADIAVVIDVLSFTTTLTIAVERGITVLPFQWKDKRAEEYAAAHTAVLAVGRLEALSLDGGEPRGVSLSPAAMANVTGVERLVLPSPNGSTISLRPRFDRGDGRGGEPAQRERRRGSQLAPLLRDGASLAVVPAGERWPDDTLRPCVEDLWGAGAVIAGLVDLGVTGLGPEARVAEQAFRAVRSELASELAACAGGVELAAAGFADDVTVAGRLDVSRVVPVLEDGAFSVVPE